MSLKKIKRAEKKGTESVMDEKFALLFWSEFSIGNGEFHYQVRKGREQQNPSWMRSLRASSGQSSPSGMESSTIRCEREVKEQSPSRMKNLRSSSGQSSPSETESSTIRYGREEREQSPSWIRTGNRVFYYPRYIREEKDALLFWSEFSIGNGEFHYQVRKRRTGTEPVMDKKFVLLFWSDFSIGNGEFHYQVRKRRTGIKSVIGEKFALLFWSEFSIGNGEFHYQVRKRREEQSQSWIRSLHSYSGQSSPSGTESFIIRYVREEKEQSPS
jgi:hypothetical protein